MFPKINNNIILVAALDWGLGHATRCIPIVENYLSQHKKIVLAGSGFSGKLLKNSFPQLSYYQLPAYNIKYSKGNFFNIKMLSQIPKILSVIKNENKSLNEIISKENIQTIISDNRYGIYKKGLQNIIVCHQLNLNATYLKSLVNTNYHSYFKNFDECWVPDFKEVLESLAGNLSHPINFNIPIKYLGPISRFKKMDVAENPNKILILLSGPEPQRSILEDILLKQINKLSNFKWIILRGTEEKLKSSIKLKDNIEVADFLNKTQIEQLICESSLIICRAGYTSLMDFVLLNKKAILIPTPGQWEQEYLASCNAKNPNFLFVNQNEIILEKCIAHFRAK